MSAYPGLLATDATDDAMVTLSRPPDVIREQEIPSMSASELHDTRAILARLLADVDRRLGALAASDQPDDDPALARRIREAKRALSNAGSGNADAGLRQRAAEVRRRMERG